MAQYFSWIRGFNRNLILSKIAGIRKIEGQRSSFSPAQTYHYWLPVLHSAVHALPIADALKEGCIAQSLSDASLSLNDPEAFLLRCDQAFVRLSNRPKSKFVLYSTITYTGSKLVDWIADGDFRIYWQPSVDGRFVRRAIKARESLVSQKHAHRVPDDNAELTTVLAKVAAYDALDAFEKANDCIDRFRGMLNLLVNSTNTIHPFARLFQPHAVNRFRRGPFHTLHRPDGSLATEMFWYQPRWEHNYPTVEFTGGPERFEKKLKGWWRKLRDSPRKDFLSEAILGYCRALDIHEADASLLGLWQVLERLTDTDKYDLLIDRITRLFHDHEDTREIANHLRVRRNRTVHSAHNISRDAHVILHQIEMLVSQAIFFSLKNGAKFRNQSEINEFLDLPLNENRLKRQQQLTQFFIRYQKRP